MEKYGVNVKETSYGFIEIEADSPEEAREKAEEEYHKGNVHWSSSEFIAKEVTE